MTQENTTPTYWNAQQLHPDVVAVFSSSLPLATAASQTPSAILLPQQTHTANVAWVTPDLLPERIDPNPSPLFPDTDALITDIMRWITATVACIVTVSIVNHIDWGSVGGRSDE